MINFVHLTWERVDIWEFSSAQFSSRAYLYAPESPYAPHPVPHKFPQRCLWNGSNVRPTDDGPLSSFQGRSSSASSFNASLLQAIDGVMSLALCPAGRVSSFSALPSFREASRLRGLLCRPVYLLGHFSHMRRGLKCGLICLWQCLIVLMSSRAVDRALKSNY